MDYSKCTYISWGKYEESPEIKVNNGDILLVKTGSSYGKCAFVESLFEKATINPQFVVLRHISINPEFLTLILQSQYARKCYNEFVIGTAIPTFTQEKLSNMFIPLPPIYEQNRIISQVSKLMVLISHIAEESLFLFKNIEHVKSKILELAITGKLVPQNPDDEPAAELLRRINPEAQIVTDNGHYPQLPANWCYCNWFDIADNQLGKTLDKEKNKGVERPYLCSINVKWNDFDTSVLKTFLLSDDEKERYSVKPGDLLICEGGDVGRCAIWQSSEEMYYQNALHRVRFKDEIMASFYLYVLMAYKDNGLIESVCNGVTIKHFTQNSIKKLLFPLPPISEQQRILKRIKEFFSMIESIEQSL